MIGPGTTGPGTTDPGTTAAGITAVAVAGTTAKQPIVSDAGLANRENLMNQSSNEPNNEEPNEEPNNEWTYNLPAHRLPDERAGWRIVRASDCLLYTSRCV